ncbi:MAG: hypothetical protein FJ296_06820, partial [Planctomycetes bacterium]|nr:hypothetical protein [Planctomycetota bacterium]
GAPAPAAGRRPDIVILMIDTLRADRLSAYGAARQTSPRIDALAAESVLFELAVSQAPWTLPSVVSLFTSSYPASHRVLSNFDSVDHSATTLVEWASGLGYYTLGFTENTLAGKGGGLDQGYDEFHEMEPARAGTGGGEDRPLPFMRRVTERLARDLGPEPLFLYVHMIAPHHPYEGTAGSKSVWFEGEAAERDSLNEALGKLSGLTIGANTGRLDAAGLESLALLAGRVAGQMDDVWALYDGDVARADGQVGQVLSLLGRRPGFEEAIVVVLADHGEEFNEHGGWMHGQSLFQELVHVPLIVRAPGRVPAGQRVAAPVRLLDLPPTLADLVDAEPLPSWQGHSLVPLMRGTAPPGDEPALSMKFSLDRKLGGALGDHETALYAEGCKLIIHHDHQKASLFDLQADPGERHDLADERPEQLARLLAQAQRLMRELPELPIASEVESRSEEKLQHLREMGYLEVGPGR